MSSPQSVTSRLRSAKGTPKDASTCRQAVQWALLDVPRDSALSVLSTVGGQERMLQAT
jgi:hypothetical protein